MSSSGIDARWGEEGGYVCEMVKKKGGVGGWVGWGFKSF